MFVIIRLFYICNKVSCLFAGSSERGDLINFYNKVYVQCMQTFALRFTGKHKDVSIVLSNNV